MSYEIPKGLKGVLAQTEAAALAVLVAHVRENMEELESERLEHANEVGVKEEYREVQAFLQELEAIACSSIACNDGNVVSHIGHAAKQMNPLLS